MTSPRLRKGLVALLAPRTRAPSKKMRIREDGERISMDEEVAKKEEAMEEDLEGLRWKTATKAERGMEDERKMENRINKKGGTSQNTYHDREI